MTVIKATGASLQKSSSHFHWIKGVFSGPSPLATPLHFSILNLSLNKFRVIFLTHLSYVIVLHSQLCSFLQLEAFLKWSEEVLITSHLTSLHLNPFLGALNGRFNSELSTWQEGHDKLHANMRACRMLVVELQSVSPRRAARVIRFGLQCAAGWDKSCLGDFPIMSMLQTSVTS